MLHRDVMVPHGGAVDTMVFAPGDAWRDNVAPRTFILEDFDPSLCQSFSYIDVFIFDTVANEGKSKVDITQARGNVFLRVEQESCG